ncbi:uncharacterized protein [Littorina saxatilis]|uniref:uncharacterized protein n=1 Tax=Littorina saxatilis TaxID=31220 RepID=UPI0038B4D36A
MSREQVTSLCLVLDGFWVGFDQEEVGRFLAKITDVPPQVIAEAASEAQRDDAIRWVVQFATSEDKEKCHKQIIQWKELEGEDGGNQNVTVHSANLDDIPEQGVHAQPPVEGMGASGSNSDLVTCQTGKETTTSTDPDVSPVRPGIGDAPSKQSVSDFSFGPSRSTGSQQLRNIFPGGASPPPPTQTTPPADTLTGEQREAQRTVEVTVPGEVPLTHDLFLYHFESARNGGGAVDDVTIDEDERVVHVVFHDSEVAKRVAERPHLIAGQSITVQMMTLNNLLEEKREAQRTVEVTVGETVPLTQDLFLHHFESPRNGGGVVDDVTIDEDERVVHVVFQHPEVASRVVERTHKIAGKPVTVRKMKFCKETAEAKTKAQRTVEVTVGETVPLTQDLFLHHFESARNGGGAVEEVTIDEDERVVHVVFHDPEVATNVAEKDHIIAGQPATVKMVVFRKSRTAKGRQPKERLEQKSSSPLKSGVRSEDPPVAPAQEDTEDRRTVEVRLGEELTVPLTQDLFLHHFESTRNGGGAVDDVTIDEDERVVNVVFKDPEGWSCGLQ